MEFALASKPVKKSRQTMLVTITALWCLLAITALCSAVHTSLKPTTGIIQQMKYSLINRLIYAPANEG